MASFSFDDALQKSPALAWGRAVWLSPRPLRYPLQEYPGYPQKMPLEWSDLMMILRCKYSLKEDTNANG